MFVQRALATLIDLIVIYLPSLFLVQILAKGKGNSMLNLLAAALFILYNMICESSFSGKTLGKYFAKLKVVSQENSLSEIGQREFTKILYFLPYGGPIFLFISIICYLIKSKFLHDIVGRSEVIATV